MRNPVLNPCHADGVHIRCIFGAAPALTFPLEGGGNSDMPVPDCFSPGDCNDSRFWTKRPPLEYGMANYETAIQQLDVACYNRPGDPAGLAYWKGVVEARGGDGRRHPVRTRSRAPHVDRAGRRRRRDRQYLLAPRCSALPTNRWITQPRKRRSMR
jgi:hypothetical protein